MIQEVEVDEVDQVSRSQLINWSASQGVEVDQLIKWSASQGVEVDQLINWSARNSWRRSIAIDHTHSHGGVQLRLITHTLMMEVFNCD